MKTKEVDSITNNGDLVRLRIFEGEFTANEAYEELLRIEKEQHQSTRAQLLRLQEKYEELRNSLKDEELYE